MWKSPKVCFFSVVTGRAVSCVNPVQSDKISLYGKGVLIACIDSGVDYAHRDFRNEDGTTRIFSLWDQTIPQSSARISNCNGNIPGRKLMQLCRVHR